MSSVRKLSLFDEEQACRCGVPATLVHDTGRYGKRAYCESCWTAKRLRLLIEINEEMNNREEDDETTILGN